ncbi:MAG: potassium transporter, partial [Muribaculaceae bacterium]|nr:potassium transporter [Muribaculaceae bacterium]
MFSRALDWLTVAASLVCLVALTLYAGFDHSVVRYAHVEPWLNACLGVFALNILFNLILRFKDTMRETKPLKWIADGLIMVTLLVSLFSESYETTVPVVRRLLLSHIFSAIILGMYAAVYLCSALIRSLGRRTNPSLILSVSFLMVIGLGSLLLMLPKCTVDGISPIDALFVSTSAVCICGLTSVDVPATFTPLGIAIIAVMMQVGALGVMTITSSFALFFSGNASIYSQLMVRDMFYSRTINSLLPTLGYTLIFTLVVEALGAVAVYLSITGVFPGLTSAQEWAIAGFHSLSAFCNAGFSNIPDGMANPALMRGNQLVYLVISLLVIAGGIGFPILVNTKDAIGERFSRLYSRLLHRPEPPRHPHLYNMNTRVALMTSGVLFLITMVLFLVFEWNGVLAGMSPYAKLVQGVFNSTTPRSSGFVSVNPAGFMPATLLMV